MSPFPVALCGKNPTLASQFVKMMDEGDDFQVVTVFNTTTQATTELPQLLSSHSSFNTTTTTTVKPISGLGSNASSPTSTAPKAIIVGAGFSGDELESMRKGIAGVEGAEKLAWFTPARMQAQRPGEPGFMEGVVGRAKEAIHARTGGDGEVEAGVHGF